MFYVLPWAQNDWHLVGDPDSHQPAFCGQDYHGPPNNWKSRERVKTPEIASEHDERNVCAVCRLLAPEPVKA